MALPWTPPITDPAEQTLADSRRLRAQMETLENRAAYHPLPAVRADAIDRLRGIVAVTKPWPRE